MSSYRIGVDTGGTFTDVVISCPADGRLAVGKSSTTRERISRGMLDAIGVAASRFNLETRELLRSTDLFIYSSTHATNAILEGKTARCGFVVTEGFAETLLRREGGKGNPWDFTEPYPAPYIARKLTFELPERMTAEGEVFRPLDKAVALEVIERMQKAEVEAVAVCLLWSIANPLHELEFAELLKKHMPGVPYTLSSVLNPVIREYRRASATAIDASLKPLMQKHLSEMEADLRGAGFIGELLVATSIGGVGQVRDVVNRPVEMVRSGPALAPILGGVYAAAETGESDVIVCDTGGTSFDVSLVRDGRPVYSRDTWLGPRYTGHLTGLASVDARSVGSGGGSIAWIDPGGLLQVGPESAGSYPGPACYGRGGERATVTDAAVVLGYLDPDYFLGGRMTLDRDASIKVVKILADRLGQAVEDTAYGILTIASEHMVNATKDITINEGVDPRESLVIAGGGAGGLNMVLIARELECKRLLFPRTAGALCACGAQFSDIVREWSVNRILRSDRFDLTAAASVLGELQGHIENFASAFQLDGETRLDASFLVEARYVGQVWEIEIPVFETDFASAEALAQLNARFHQTHKSIFAIDDPDQHIEYIHWRGKASIRIKSPDLVPIEEAGGAVPAPEKHSRVFFRETGWVEIPVYRADRMKAGMEIAGPALLIEDITTIVLYPGSRSRVTALGNHMVEIEPPHLHVDEQVTA